MIHMGMGHENVADPEDFTGRKRLDIAEVEQDCPAPEAKIDQEPGIGEDVIDEPRLDEPRRGRLPRWAREGLTRPAQRTFPVR
jgi:hypothetical protein